MLNKTTRSQRNLMRKVDTNADDLGAGATLIFYVILGKQGAIKKKKSNQNDKVLNNVQE